MFYSIIQNKRDQWYKSQDCTVKELINYIINTNELRDAQIDAIKTYLFLKIKCKNLPLWELFYNGTFNSINIDDLEIKQQLKDFFTEYPCALSLYQYAITKNDKGEKISPKLEEQIKKNYNNINYKQVFKDIFYNVDYTDYLFSLPMGAGKTFLMACFIYLDLYFALNEPQNKSFAHNFIIFAPSGLKSSVIPSLRTIQKFNPTWVIPEPSATKIKRMIKFEVLDQSKTDKKSNKIKNPNVQKIAIHQPLSELFGLIAITNAEKVILDRTDIQDENQLLLLSRDEQAKYRAANELRSLIGNIPSLSIFIDEVHHAVKNNIKLRSIINDWTQNETINSIIGFSGTPYLDNTEKINITDTFVTENKEISNNVFYYPLVKGIGNFLKKPNVKISNSKNRLEIVENGIREFLDKYNDKVYANKTIAKLAIYCGTIENLEEIIYPKICEILTEYALNPNEVILKFHKGNNKYPEPQNAQLDFETLDKSISKKKIILLVQIGKEGWDCKSLTGVILSQEGDCPVNMVLQTSCRCLRQVDKNKTDSALIYLNEDNADKLNMQLKKLHHIDIKAFERGTGRNKTIINRYNRMKQTNLSPIEYYQLSVQYETLVIEKANVSESIKNSTLGQKYNGIITTQDFDGNIVEIDTAKEFGSNIANFNLWLHRISKGSFNSIILKDLGKYEQELKTVFDEITYTKDDTRYFSSKYNITQIEANIRKAFSDKRSFSTKEETIKDNANLLVVEKLTSPIETSRPDDFIPTQDKVESIIKEDEGKLTLSDEMQQSIKTLRSNGLEQQAQEIEDKFKSNTEKDKTYHYIPYKTDSSFEKKFLNKILTLNAFNENDLEVYYNGDEVLTELKIKTYKGSKNNWKYMGLYTPDFLIIKRKNNEIHKIMIVETKGEGFAKNFKEKKEFMENNFIPQNNKKFGYNRFDFLYLQDDMAENDLITVTSDKIKDFFKENE
ncbi:DEAD/DEAH box helicase family protein [bacterium]|nr:DEAD/DEAH box helicase family protein [bacterium]